MMLLVANRFHTPAEGNAATNPLILYDANKPRVDWRRAEGVVGADILGVRRVFAS